MLLNEVLLGRSPSDLELLVTSYHKAFVKDLRTEVHKEVSGNHKISTYSRLLLRKIVCQQNAA